MFLVQLNANRLDVLEVKMKHELIQVRYGNGREGSVDDLTLNELILSHKIGQFYRPSQEKWINIETDPVRIRKDRYGEHARRESDKEEATGELEEKPPWPAIENVEAQKENHCVEESIDCRRLV